VPSMLAILSTNLFAGLSQKCKAQVSDDFSLSLDLIILRSSVIFTLLHSSSCRDFMPVGNKTGMQSFRLPLFCVTVTILA